MNRALCVLVFIGTAACEADPVPLNTEDIGNQSVLDTIEEITPEILDTGPESKPETVGSTALATCSRIDELDTDYEDEYGDLEPASRSACSKVSEQFDCDDGVVCTEDFCVTGECRNNPDAFYCYDSDTTTNDWCDPVNGCRHDPFNESEKCTDDIACEDGDPCTTNYCILGMCSSKASLCDDSDPCTEDFCRACKESECDIKSFVCEHTSSTSLPCCIEDTDCIDKDTCTLDTCISGDCQHSIIEHCDKICEYSPYWGCSPCQTVDDCTAVELWFPNFAICLENGTCGYGNSDYAGYAREGDAVGWWSLEYVFYDHDGDAEGIGLGGGLTGLLFQSAVFFYNNLYEPEIVPYWNYDVGCIDHDGFFRLPTGQGPEMVCEPY